MWALIGTFFSKFGVWFIAAGGVVLALFSAKKQGAAEAQVVAANQRADDREAIAVREVDEATAAADTRIQKTNEATNEATKASALDSAGLADSLQQFERK